MDPENQGLEVAPETAALDEATPAPDETPESAAPQAPAFPPELVEAVAARVSGEIRTLHGEIRRSQAELRSLLAQPQTPQAYSLLSQQLKDLEEQNDFLFQALVPEEQRDALKQQRELQALRRKVASPPPPPTPAPAQPQPTSPVSDPAFVAASATAAGYAEALGLDLSTVTDAEKALMRQGLSEGMAPEQWLPVVKANMRSLVDQRKQASAPKAPPPDPQADVRQQVRQTTTAPAARAGGATRRPTSLADAERMLAQDEITVGQFRAWGFA